MAQMSYQVTAEEVQRKDIAEHYIRIEENTEYLTNIIRHQTGRTHKLFNFDILTIELRSFCNLIVQSCYLIYTCYVKKSSLFFSKNLFINFPKEGGVEVVIEFLLEKEWKLFDENKKRDIEANFNYINPFKYENAYAECVLNLLKGYLGIIKEYSKKQREKKFPVDRVASKQLEALENVLGLLSMVSQKGIKPKTLITFLEQTQVFRNYSYLLKTLNCSIYQAIRKTGNFDRILQEIKKKQAIFNQRYSSMARQNMIQCESLQSCLEDFICLLIDNQIVQTEASVKSKSISTESVRDKSQIKIGSSVTNKPGKHEDRIYSWKILIEEKRMRECNQKVILGLAQGETTTIYSSEDTPKVQNLIHIEYIAKTNMLNVEYISNIEVSVENTDALIYYCNNMVLEMSNVTVEHIERESTKNKRKERVPAFKVTTTLNPRENPFISVLFMIDRALIYGKVCEPEILRKITRVEETSRFTVAMKRINHLSSLFIKKVRRLYEMAGSKNKQ